MSNDDIILGVASDGNSSWVVAHKYGTGWVPSLSSCSMFAPSTLLLESVIGFGCFTFLHRGEPVCAVHTVTAPHSKVRWSLKGQVGVGV